MNYVNTLDKFGVKLDGHNQRTKFPHLKTRYRVTFFGLNNCRGSDNITMDIKKCDEPKGSFAKQEINTWNGDIYYPGKWTWDPISFDVYNSYDNLNYKELYGQIQQQRDLSRQVTGTVSQNYKFLTKFERTDGHHNGVLTWIMEGCFLTKAQGDGGENGSHDASIISCEIVYDNAVMYDYDGTLINDPGAMSTFMARNMAY